MKEQVAKVVKNDKTSGRSTDTASPPPAKGRPTREEKLAAALRANLRRRKTAAKPALDPSEDGPDGAGTPESGDADRL